MVNTNHCDQIQSLLKEKILKNTMIENKNKYKTLFQNIVFQKPTYDSEAEGLESDKQ